MLRISGTAAIATEKQLSAAAQRRFAQIHGVKDKPHHFGRQIATQGNAILHHCAKALSFVHEMLLERVAFKWVHATRSTSLFFEHLHTFR
jgi:hypothetical protein